MKLNKKYISTLIFFLVAIVSLSNAFQNDANNDDDKINQGVSDMINKPSQSLYDQIVSRLFHHHDSHIEIEKSIQQFGNFWNSLKKTAEKHQKRQQLKTTGDSVNTDTTTSSGESKQDVRDHQHLEQQQDKHHSHKHNHKGFHYNSKNKDNKLVEIGIAVKATLGKKPITDGLTEWLDRNPQELQATASLVGQTLDNSICNSGILQSSSETTNTCNGGEECFIHEMLCNSKYVLVDKNTHLADYDLKQCQVLTMYCPKTNEPVKYIDFKQQYGLNSCKLNSTKCSTDLLSSCEIDVVCDKFTQFNTEKYGFYCVNNQLLCNNVVVPYDEYNKHSDDIKNGKCSTVQVPCTSTNDQCLRLSLNCPTPNNCTLNQQVNSCKEYYCTRSLNTTSCDCPVDYTGTNCQSSEPFTCDVVINSPSTMCKGADFLLSPNPCFSFSHSDKVKFNYSLKCSFLKAPKSPKHKFTYWVDQPKFKISKPAVWEFLSENINLYRLFNNSLLNVIQLDNQQIAGQSPIWVNTTLANIPQNYWIAKRVYTEVSLSTPIPQTSRNGRVADNTLTMAKYFIYAHDYPDRENTNSGIPDWKLAIFIVLGVVCTIALAIAAFIFYRMKLKVN
ncbi:hypothetical protein CYY_001830 [Polysphondylium violaceum]|uniref:EGF-like domain-containing protein n=1 Tax=Polysphondylium violaceum TaxID=133409 RepID=A0A8J4PXP2_9MYCE|nr:hypothetical protein CYY_001830 [Polysphondylium violaceum]